MAVNRCQLDGCSDVPPLLGGVAIGEYVLMERVLLHHIITFITAAISIFLCLPSYITTIKQWFSPPPHIPGGSNTTYHCYIASLFSSSSSVVSSTSVSASSRDNGCLDPSTTPGRGSGTPHLVSPATASDILYQSSSSPHTRGIWGAFLVDWLKGIIAAISIIGLLDPLPWLHSVWQYLTRALGSKDYSKMESYTGNKYDSYFRQLQQYHQITPTPTICSCGAVTKDPCHAGPSGSKKSRAEFEKREKDRYRTPEVWEYFDDNDPWLPAKGSECEHRMMMVTFAEHVLSRADFLPYFGGSPRDRKKMIKTIKYPYRGVLLKLVSDTDLWSPYRNCYDSISVAPCYSASDMARALFHHKHHFDQIEWYIICVEWFEGWTGYSISDALLLDVGNKEFEDRWVADMARMELEGDVEGLKRVQPKLRRQFRAFAYWEEGYKYAAF
ncbi:hypothetical protein TWF481_000719 [Arthrobotrys musiformis]|uniref:Uncharacterized protein n=1 Tax=Arthrobotrys musiformis TaxID=47236 RepID=A0AAV9WQ83_9PEZI